MIRFNTVKDSKQRGTILEIRQDFFGLPGAHEFATYLHGEPIDSHPLTWAFRAGVNHSKSGEEPTPMGRIDATSVFRCLTDNSRCWGDS
jgi:hypothetical protein